FRRKDFVQSVQQTREDCFHSVSRRRRLLLYSCSLSFNGSGMSDANIWGLLAMPLGVALCFGPILFLWLRAEIKESGQEGSTRSEKNKHFTTGSEPSLKRRE